MGTPLGSQEHVSLQFGPLASRTVRRYISLVISHPFIVTCHGSCRKLAPQLGLESQLLPSGRSRMEEAMLAPSPGWGRLLLATFARL